MASVSSRRGALITGGSSGIGYAVAQALTEQGYNITITGRRFKELEAAAEQLGPMVRAVGCDVRDPQALEQAVARHLEHAGRLDVLVVNAGVGRFAPVSEFSLEQWREVIDTNLSGAFYTVKAALPALQASQGHIFTIGSLAGRNPFAGGAAYNASKFGLNALSEVLNLELRAQGVKVTQLMPGSTATHFNGHEPGDQDAWKIQPEDLAQLIVEVLRLPTRTLPSRIEVRPSRPKG